MPFFKKVPQWASQLGQVKSIASLKKDIEGSEMKRTLGAVDLTFLGIGGIIGTGIFVLTGQAAEANAGPAVVLSFVIAGIAACFAALCYSEMAAMIPVAGSAYTYSYATMGEFAAWLIGWDLILEYLVGSAAVAVGWSGYFVAFLHDVCGLEIGSSWTNSPIQFKNHEFAITGDVINLPAMIIVLLVTAVLCFGIKESARFNAAVVFIKVTVVVLFIGFGVAYVNVENWTPFIPENTGTMGKYGVSGLFQGASMVFFAYIGFDAITTAAQETKNPQRDLPIGIIVSLVVCTILYVGVSLVLTGLVPYTELGVPHPIALGVKVIGQPWLAAVVDIGAVAGLTSVLLVMLMGQPRIFYSMANDGLFPQIATKIHPKYKTPYITTIITGVICSIAAGLLPIGVLGELTSIGTLFAFFLVCVGVMVLRLTRPEIERPFKVPFGPYVIPILGALSSLVLVMTATVQTILRLAIWMLIGVIIYFCYSRHHSKFNAAVIARQLDAEKA